MLLALKYNNKGRVVRILTRRSVAVGVMRMYCYFCEMKEELISRVGIQESTTLNIPFGSRPQYQIEAEAIQEDQFSQMFSQSLNREFPRNN
jgi:hypothetical protein